MWLTLALKALSAVFGVGQEYLEHRQQVEALQQQGELDTIKAKNSIMVANATADTELDKIDAAQMQYSWKDEYWTIILSTPFVLGILPFEWSQVCVAKFFQILDTAPDWYRIAVGTAIATSFGARHIINYFKKSP